MLPGSSHMPPKPIPFTISEWRKVWGAYWHQANREAINWAILNGRTY
jgi:hypothetical protein